MPLEKISWLGHQHTRNSLAIASRLKKIQGRSRGFYLDAYQNQKNIKSSGESSECKSAGGSWICSTADDYLAVLDSFGVICIGVYFLVDDNDRSWAD